MAFGKSDYLYLLCCVMISCAKPDVISLPKDSKGRLSDKFKSGMLDSSRFKTMKHNTSVDGNFTLPESKKLPPLKNRAELEMYILHMLGSKNPQERFFAAREAGRFRIQSALIGLSKIAQTSSPGSIVAIYSLGQLGGKDAANALKKCIGRNTPLNKKRLIAKALGKTLASNALAPLLKLLKTDSLIFKVEIIYALVELQDTGAIKPLKLLLNNSTSTQLRLASASALAALGDTAGFGVLQETLLLGRPEHKAQAVIGLANIMASSSANDQMRQQAAGSIASSLASKHANVWLNAARATINTPSPYLRQILTQHANSNNQALSERATLLLAVENPNAISQMRTNLLSTDVALRLLAVELISRYNSHSARDALIAATFDKSDTVAKMAIVALARFSDSTTNDALSKLARGNNINRAKLASQILKTRATQLSLVDKSEDDTTETTLQDSNGFAYQLLDTSTTIDGRNICAVRRRGDNKVFMLNEGERTDDGYLIWKIYPKERSVDIQFNGERFSLSAEEANGESK